jgi:hypothetical protein
LLLDAARCALWLGEAIMSVKGPPRLGTITAACKLIGGDKPIDRATYYRGVKRGIYPAPLRLSPNVSRVDLDKLEAAIRARAALGDTLSSAADRR